MNDQKPFWKSLKFWTAISVAVSALVKQYADIEIPDEFFHGLLALIVGQGLADFGKNKK